MIETFLLAGALVVQGVAQYPSHDTAIQRIDAAYEELASGENSAAIAKLQTTLKRHAENPSALINLGTAYARTGRTNEAADCFRAAQTSRERQDLELADGSWMDSRKAAILARQRLSQGQILALK